MKKRINKKGIVSDYLPWLLIAIAILAILLIFFAVLKDKGVGLIDKIKDLFRGFLWLNLQ